jgi:hypothetical protein
MFMKNPFILPVFALIFLVALYIFQNQQKHKAAALKAAAADAVVAQLTLKDPVFGSSQGVAAKCDGKAWGLEYPVAGKIEKGRIEFDLFGFSGSEIQDLPLFALHPADVSPCPQPLLEKSLLALSLNIKTDSLRLTVRTSTGVFSGSAFLTDRESPPFRLMVEWVADTATLYLNGTRTADVKYSGAFPAGGNSLFLGESQERKAAELRSLKLYLVP